MTVNVDTIEDETSYFNLGQQDEHAYMNFKMEQNEITSWKNYPDQYKFYSVHFSLNLDVTTMERRTYDVLDMVENTGGMIEFLFIVFSFASYHFSSLRLKALITNRIYWVAQSTKETILKNTKFTD